MDVLEWYHHQVLRVACLLTGDKELGLFTLHKALLQFLGYDWWDGPERGLGWTFKRVVHPGFYTLLLLTVSILTIHRCFSLDTNTSIGYIVFMNNIIVVFTLMYAALKSIYMKVSYGKEARYLMTMLEELGNLKQGRPVWESSLKAFSYYLCLLLNMCFFWAVYCLWKYRILAYETSYPWDQKTFSGMTIAFQMSFVTAFYASMVHSSVDSLISVSCGVMMGHLNVVIDMLHSIGQPGSTDTALLTAAVHLHSRLLRASSKMNYCFNCLFAFQYVYTVLHACVVIYAIIKSDDMVGALLNTMLMLIASYTQLFLYCYYSQKLTSKDLVAYMTFILLQFEELTFASYNNHWYRSSLHVQNGLLMFSRISERHIALRGIGEAYASYASYLNCIKESISFYLFLKTMTADNSESP